MITNFNLKGNEIPSLSQKTQGSYGEDFNVLQQLVYSRKFGQPNENPEIDLLDIGVCQECYQKKVFLRNKSEEEKKQKLLSGYDDLISKQAEFLEKNIELFKEFISKRIESFNLDEISIIIGEDFDPDLGDKYASPKKKKGLWNVYFQQNIRDKVVPYFLKCAFSDPTISQVISNHNQSSEKQWAELRKLFPKNIISIYAPTLISQTENLNDYIRYETTVRSPTKDTPDVNFYHQIDFPLDDDIESDFLISEEDISRLIIDEYFENALKDKTLGMILK
jgi:hypothetical protein